MTGADLLALLSHLTAEELSLPVQVDTGIDFVNVDRLALVLPAPSSGCTPWINLVLEDDDEYGDERFPVVDLTDLDNRPPPPDLADELPDLPGR